MQHKRSDIQRRNTLRPPLSEILKDPVKRKQIMIRTIIATQAREGITTSYEQAEAAYNKIQQEKNNEQK